MHPDPAGAESATEDEAACEQRERRWRSRRGSSTADKLTATGEAGDHATSTVQAVYGLNQETDTEDYVSKEDRDIINYGIRMM